MVRFAIFLHNLFGGRLYEYVFPREVWGADAKLIRSPAFNRLAARTHAKVQQMKMRLTSSEEELQQLRENERLLKEAEDKFKSIEADAPGTLSLVLC
jgi:hypothetical protein